MIRPPRPHPTLPRKGGRVGWGRGERSADRRNHPLSALRKRGSAPCAADKSTRTCANHLRGALASRRSTAALARLLHLTQLQARFSGTRSKRALPALSCPSPVKAPHAPAVVPADMMPKAARERIANPRAGTALAPPFGLASREAPLDERDGRFVTEIGTDVKGHLVIRDAFKFVIRGLDPRIYADVPGRMLQLSAL